MCNQRAREAHGFSLIELLVVLAAIALLLSIVAPRYVQHVDRAREAALRSNLAALRDAIDRYQLDRGQYPANLSDLVEGRYLRTVPVDPMTERENSWLLLAPAGQVGRVADVRSAAVGNGSDGKPYASW